MMNSNFCAAAFLCAFSVPRWSDGLNLCEREILWRECVCVCERERERERERESKVKTNRDDLKLHETKKLVEW